MLNYNMKKLYDIEPTKYQPVYYPKHNNYLKPLLNTYLIAYCVLNSTR